MVGSQKNIVLPDYDVYQSSDSFLYCLFMQIVMSNLREETTPLQMYETYDEGEDDSMRGMNDPDWDMWEEWMGWEGAGIRDYTSHINPYI